MGYKVNTVNGDLVQNKLLFDDRDDLVRCLKAYGFSPDPQTGDYDPRVRSEQSVWQTTMRKFKQKSLGFLDAKRNLSTERMRKDFVLRGINMDEATATTTNLPRRVDKSAILIKV